MAQKNEKPIKDFRSGNLQASIWRNEIQRDGETIVRHSIRIQKRYRKEDGNYENTDYFFPDELPKLQLLAQKAYEYVVLTESKELEEAVPV